jgi:hypothetical protein
MTIIVQTPNATTGYTFLDLCKKLRQEAGVSGTGPTSVLDQQGEMKRLVDWIARAYEDIQNAEGNWNFLRQDFTFPTIAGVQEYTPDAVALPEHESWMDQSFRIYQTDQGVNDEQWITYWPWESFRDAYIRSGNRTVQGRPIAWTIRPNDEAVVVWPTPDIDYTIVGEYMRRPHTLQNNNDFPLFARQYQMALVWRALMWYGTYESAPELYATGQAEFNRVMRALRRDQLPQIVMGGSIV